MRISDLSSDVCSSDLVWEFSALFPVSVIAEVLGVDIARRVDFKHWVDDLLAAGNRAAYGVDRLAEIERSSKAIRAYFEQVRSEEHTSELQSLMRISYAVFCLKKKKINKTR